MMIVDEEVAQAYGPFKGGTEAWSPNALRPFAYLFTPKGLGLEYGFLTGLLRLLHLIAARQALGDPILSLVLAAGRARRARRREREAVAAFGPERPDRQSLQGEDVVIVAARPKEVWRVGAAVRVGDEVREVREAAVVPDLGAGVRGHPSRTLGMTDVRLHPDRHGVGTPLAGETVVRSNRRDCVSF